MKQEIRRVGLDIPMTLEEVDVDSDPELRRKYGEEVPVLFINGRKAFKYRLRYEELAKKLRWGAK
jgi:hypothetical protein